MAVNIDTFISKKKCTFFLEVALAIYLIRYNITNLPADGHKQDASHKANCDVHNALMCFKCYPEHTVLQVLSNPSNTWKSYHNNTPQKGSNWFVAIRMSSMDFGFQIILKTSPSTAEYCKHYNWNTFSFNLYLNSGCQNPVREFDRWVKSMDFNDR